MIDFSDIRLNQNEPVYIQLAEHVKRKIISGQAAEGDALPSRRELAASLAINPNTAQKAYRLMEEEGFLETPRNAASHIRLQEGAMERIRYELCESFVKEFVSTAKKNNLSYREVIGLISSIWED